jgi:hypothetical protein
MGLFTKELCSPPVFLEDTLELSGITWVREREALHGRGMKFVNVWNESCANGEGMKELEDETRVAAALIEERDAWA